MRTALVDGCANFRIRWDSHRTKSSREIVEHVRAIGVGQQRVSELLEQAGTRGNRWVVDLAQSGQMRITESSTRVLAMQKVEGSSPFIRSQNPRKSGVLFAEIATCVPDESQSLRSKWRLGFDVGGKPRLPLGSIGDTRTKQPLAIACRPGSERAACLSGSGSADRCDRGRRRGLDGRARARDVSFLIADYSGQSLIRLSHVRRAHADDDDVNRERGQAVPLAGTPHGRALAEQEVQTIGDADGFRVFAPVTSRGEAVGVLSRARQRA